MISKQNLKKINDYLFEIPKSFRPDMKVPARIYADQNLLEAIEPAALEQVVNVAALGGIQKYSLAMPDIHTGYGFVIGGVAAMKISEGVISPGGIGYDINCGVRLLKTGLNFDQIKSHLPQLAEKLNRAIPSGVGSRGKIKLDRQTLDRVLSGGARQIISQGYGLEKDLENCEAGGFIKEADSSKVSDRAKNRGRDQLGTLGSGNHFLEIQKVDQIFSDDLAKIFGLKINDITILIHTGSRGLGHQVCTDWVRIFNSKMSHWGFRLPDRELACAPINSLEGQGYFKAMSAAANYAWANRQVITHLTRQAWKEVLGEKTPPLDLIYDVAHNIGKLEEHEVDGKIQKLIVHRKGATRAFPPGHPELPKVYQPIGQPVLIPGSMGTASYLLIGAEKGKESFYSVCHGAGRTMSRTQAKRTIWGSDLIKELANRGIIIKCGSPAGLAEEAPLAYKDIDRVVEIVDKAGLAKKVSRMVPLVVIKGE